MSQREQPVDEEAPTQVFERPRHSQSRGRVAGSGDGLWDTKDVAAYLKVSRSWVYHRAEAGLLPCVRIGSLLRFDPQVIRRLAGGSTGEG
jgi:excisionase family DNA binding protein